MFGMKRKFSEAVPLKQSYLPVKAGSSITVNPLVSFKALLGQRQSHMINFKY